MRVALDTNRYEAEAVILPFSFFESFERALPTAAATEN